MIVELKEVEVYKEPPEMLIQMLQGDNISTHRCVIQERIFEYTGCLK
jgi:hypothetical protein